MVRFGVPGQNVDSLAYADSRLSTVPVINAPRRPTVDDKKFPMWCEWRVNKDATAPATEGEFWKLIRFESNGDATWSRFFPDGVSSGVVDLRDQVATDVTVDAVTGKIDIDGGVVANAANPSGIPLETVADPATSTLDVQIQVATERTGAPGDKNDAGICSFDDTAFSVDADGYVTLAGGPGAAVDSVDVDFNTAPGTDPVVADASGQISIVGSTVANATNANSPIASHSRGVNAFNVEIQVAVDRTGAPADMFDAGICSFDDTAFTVDANGYVTLIGGPGPAVDSIDVDFNTGPGTDPVVPSGTGVVIVAGSTVANATNASAPVASHSRAANAYNIEVQVAAARTGAPGDKFDAGLCSFDDTAFAVDADGYVTLAGGAGPSIDSVDVDFNTGPGTDPVVPDGSGVIVVAGSTVANATNASAPLASHSRAANTYTMEIQVAADRTGAPGDKFDAGICSFDDTAFAVDADGYVTLAGGAGPSIDSIDVDFNTGPGTDPVVPDGSGVVAVVGNTVANATNANAPIASHSRAANSYTIEAQVGAAVAATPGDKFDAGLLSMDNQYFSVTTHGFTAIEERLLQLPVGTSLNLGINYSSPTFTVSGSDGTALSATNPAWIVLPSDSNYGYKVVHKITSNMSFDDDSGTSDLTGNLWGTTTGIDWDSAMPFYIYGVAKDADAAATLMISRVPHKNTSSAVGNIAKSGSAVASTQGSMFAIDSGINVADYDDNPCVAIGSFRMAKNDAANDDWTVETMNTKDGIGKFQEGRNFGLPGDQNGATSSTLSSSVGGDTIPTFQNIANGYSISKSGICRYVVNWNNITGSGAGAGLLQFHVPLLTAWASTHYAPPATLQYLNNGASTFNTACAVTPNGRSLYFEMIFHGVGTAKVTPADLSTDKKNGDFSVHYLTYSV
jgi:hypothetical protein